LQRRRARARVCKKTEQKTEQKTEIKNRSKKTETEINKGKKEAECKEFWQQGKERKSEMNL